MGLAKGNRPNRFANIYTPGHRLCIWGGGLTAYDTPVARSCCAHRTRRPMRAMDEPQGVWLNGGMDVPAMGRGGGGGALGAAHAHTTHPAPVMH